MQLNSIIDIMKRKKLFCKNYFNHEYLQIDTLRFEIQTECDLVEVIQVLLWF